MIINQIVQERDADKIIPYLVSLYPDTPIGIVNTDKLIELDMPTKTDAELTAIIDDLRIKFPAAF